MSDSWERLFSKPNLPKNDLPAITEDNAPLFRLQTEQRTDYLKQIKREGEIRNKEDIRLEEEMHSFGMIECGWFDPETKMIAILPEKRQSVSIPAKRFTPPTSAEGSHWTLVDATQSCLLEPDKWIYLTPLTFTTDKTAFITKMTAGGNIYEGAAAFPATVTITRGSIDSSTDSVVVSIGGCGALIMGGNPVFPIDGESVDVKITEFENHVKFFK